MTILVFCLFLQIPYPAQPDWESIDNDYTTGGALVDIDLDGDIDFVTGNGNDMAQDPNRVYYNLGDSLETVASWSSSDVGYNAHISVGDINYDGYPDLAVANYGDPYTPQYDKFYYNQAGTYQSNSSWRPHDLDNSFGCAFGDMDGDGDLDLAVACGEDYGDSLQKAKVYLNSNGVLDTLPVWESDIESYFYDAAWVDIDNDGDLDLALAGMHRKNLIYRNDGGMLESSPYWSSAGSLGTIKLAFGDVDSDGDLDMVCANNGQTGGASNCELYLNNGTTLDSTPSWTSQNLTYYSCVALGDVDYDGDLDLAAGGWWESVKVFENNGGTYPQTPSWQWLPSNPYELVCENICFGDVDNTLPSQVFDEIHIVDAAKRVFYLNNRWIKNVSRIRRTSGELSRDEYCFSYTDGWVSVADLFTQEETLFVDYTYSKDLDLLVTNWHAARGNFLFFNRYAGSSDELVNRDIKKEIRFPTVSRGVFFIESDLDDISFRIFDASGRFVSAANGARVVLDRPGVYFIRIFDGEKEVAERKVVVLH